MKQVLIPKRSGGTRTIYVQGPREKHNYRLVAAALEARLDDAPNSDVAHGFREGRSPVTNARQHIGYRFTLLADLSDFFDNVTAAHLERAGCPKELADSAMYDGAARQGLSSSPAAANLAATLMDADILAMLPAGARYTRYADDLAVSHNDIDELLAVRDALPAIAERHGWKIKPSKTRVQSQSHGNRIICGVAVSETGISATRSARRKLRAAQHRRAESNKTRGLAEWCKLKTPTGNTFGRCHQTAIIAAAKTVFGK